MLKGPPARDGITNHSGWALYHFGSTGKVYNPPDTAVVDDEPRAPADPPGAVEPGAADFDGVVVLVVGVVVLVVGVVVLVVGVVVLVVGVVVLVVGVVVLVVGVVVLVVGVVVLVVGVVVLVVGVVVLVVGVVVLVVGVVVLVVGVVVLVVGVVVLVVEVVAVSADVLSEADAPELCVIDTTMVSVAHTTAAATRRAVGPTPTCLLVGASGRGLEEAFSSSNAASVRVRDHLSAGAQARRSSCWRYCLCDCLSATAAPTPRHTPRQPRGFAGPLTHLVSLASWHLHLLAPRLRVRGTRSAGSDDKDLTGELSRHGAGLLELDMTSLPYR